MGRWLSKGERDQRDKEIVRLRGRGLTHEQIAWQTRANPSCVSKVLKGVWTESSITRV